jgi:Na+/proline symporter
MDFFKPLSRRNRTDGEWLAFARAATLVWGGILFLIALVAQGVKSVLEAGLSIASVIYGALLGVFLLGVLTRRVQERAAMAGMLAGLLTMLYVKFATPIAFTWYVLIGTSVTVFTGILSSYIVKEKENA